MEKQWQHDLDSMFDKPTAAKAARHSAGAMLRAVRAFSPKPGAWGTVEGVRVKVWEAMPADDGPEPGAAEVRSGRVVLGTRDGAVTLVTVQPAGKGPMAAIDWMRGRRGLPARFESPTR